MSSSSRELLHLEHKNVSASPLESSLLVCKKESVSHNKKAPPDGKPITNRIAQSQVLGKVKDFLGVISEANKRLQQDAKDNTQNYDIEVLTGAESEVIEMDLMLGIADLHTSEAITAAESAISNGQPSVPSDSDSSETESEEYTGYFRDHSFKLAQQILSDDNCATLGRRYTEAVEETFWNACIALVIFEG
ncbi:hypothetical protein GH714_030557 [Hevea brasiliensis]|uniref:Uncharacterized protein n=1 Tax=Hevea brasiliensis TaxID=3981 RepID=A0A6A6N3J8_HEVBR|nr:hypothetical protein GH714_030557 [Hevea brasiliensis]